MDSRVDRGRIGLALVVVATLVMAFAIVGIGAVYAQEDLPPQEPVCPETPGATVVDLTASGLLLSHRGESFATGVKVNVAIPAGVYDIRLTSFDSHVHPDGTMKSSQPREQYVVRGYSGGSEVWRSSAISDLPDNENLLTETVDVAVSVPDLDAIDAYHAFWPDKSSPNSIEPVCIAFIPVETTTTSPTTTTTSPTTTTTSPTTTTTSPTTTTTSPTTTTTPPPETTTTPPPETTTTTPSTTTTTEPLTTSTTTTTLGAEVLGTDVLPLTGLDSDLLALFALALAASGVLVLIGARRSEE